MTGNPGADFRTPEEDELLFKQDRLQKLKADLENKELDLATLKATLQSFEQLYIKKLGGKFAEYDRVLAEIAGHVAAGKAHDQAARKEAESARARAEATEQAAFAEGGPEKAVPFSASDDLKKLYRQVARTIHPDLADNEDERARRHELMTEANRAFEDNDEEALRRILSEWVSNPDMVQGEGTAAELVRVIRQLAQIDRRLEVIAEDIEGMKQSDLYRLFQKSTDAGKDRSRFPGADGRAHG